MKYLLLLAILLSGCTVPVTQKFPRVPDSQMVPPPTELGVSQHGATSSEVVEIVINNYGIYYQVADQLRGWQKWYQDQKKIFDTVE